MEINLTISGFVLRRQKKIALNRIVVIQAVVNSSQTVVLREEGSGLSRAFLHESIIKLSNYKKTLLYSYLIGSCDPGVRHFTFCCAIEHN